VLCCRRPERVARSSPGTAPSVVLSGGGREGPWFLVLCCVVLVVLGLA